MVFRQCPVPPTLNQLDFHMPIDISIRLAEREDAQLIFGLRSDCRLKGMQYRPTLWESPELYVEVSRKCSELPEPCFRCWTVLIDGNFGGHISETLQKNAEGYAIVSLGWNIVPERWGQGIAPQAIRMVLSRGFAHHKSIEFVAFCFQSNSRCRRVLEKLGFQEEAPTISEKLKNWMRTFGRQRLLKSRLTREKWAAKQPRMDHNALNRTNTVLSSDCRRSPEFE